MLKRLENVSNQESEEQLFKRLKFYYQIFRENWFDIAHYHNEKKTKEAQQRYYEELSRFLDMKN